MSRIWGHSLPSENVTKALTPTVSANLSNGKLYPSRRRHLLGHSFSIGISIKSFQGARETFPANAGKVSSGVFYSIWCTPDLPGICREGLQRFILQYLVHSRGLGKPSRHLLGRSAALYFTVPGALPGLLTHGSQTIRCHPPPQQPKNFLAKFLCAGWTPDWRVEIWKC